VVLEAIEHPDRNTVTLRFTHEFEVSKELKQDLRAMNGLDVPKLLTEIVMEELRPTIENEVMNHYWAL
jgi:hypothetical protein